MATLRNFLGTDTTQQTRGYPNPLDDNQPVQRYYGANTTQQTRGNVYGTGGSSPYETQSSSPYNANQWGGAQGATNSAAPSTDADAPFGRDDYGTPFQSQAQADDYRARSAARNEALGMGNPETSGWNATYARIAAQNQNNTTGGNGSNGGGTGGTGATGGTGGTGGGTPGATGTQADGSIGSQTGAVNPFLDPGYQFRLDQGTKALQSNGAASGMLQSGQMGKDLVQFGQNAGSQEYANAFNRMMQQANYGTNLAQYNQQFGYNAARDDRNFNNSNDQWNQQFNYNAANNDQNFNLQKLLALLGAGVNGTNQAGNSNNWLATILGNNTLTGGQVAAGGQIGGSNAINNAISQWLSQYGNNQIVGALNGGK